MNSSDSIDSPLTVHVYFDLSAIHLTPSILPPTSLISPSFFPLISLLPLPPSPLPLPSFLSSLSPPHSPSLFPPHSPSLSPPPSPPLLPLPQDSPGNQSIMSSQSMCMFTSVTDLRTPQPKRAAVTRSFGAADKKGYVAM